MQITFTVHAVIGCNLAWQTRMGYYTHRQWHAPVFWSINQRQSSSDGTEKRKISLFKTQRLMFTSLQNIVHDFIENLNTNTCTIRCLKRNFSRLYKLRKRSSEVCNPSQAWMSFRRVIRRVHAIVASHWQAWTKRNQTFSRKEFLKLKYRSLSQYDSLSGSFATNSAATVNCNSIYSK